MSHGPVRVVADAAEWMIENGAEVGRVQEASGELALALGMRDCECFALPTGVILTITDGAGFTTTVVRRIPRRTLHLDRLARLEQVIREASALKIKLGEGTSWSLGEVWLRLKEAGETPGYPLLALVPACGLASGGFALFFGGTGAEGLAAFLIGALWALLKHFLDHPRVPAVFTTTLGAFLMVAACFGLSRLVPGLGAAPPAIGCLMLLVPGLALVNALRDLVSGELVSSQARFSEVFLTAAAVAVGASAALAWLGGGL